MSELVKIDLHVQDNLVPVETVDVGFAIKYELQQLKNAGKATQAQITKFKKEVCAFLVKMCRHMNESSPLSHLFAKCSISLSPIYMAEYTERAELYFEKLLFLLVAERKLKPSVADSAKSEYSLLVNVIVKENKDEFLLYQKDTDRLEAFLWKFIGSASQFMNLRNVVKLVLILSHGQAQVERGFSTNRGLLDQTMRGDILIAQRMDGPSVKIANSAAEKPCGPEKCPVYLKLP